MKVAFAAFAVIAATLIVATSLAERPSPYQGAKRTPCGFIRVGNGAKDRLQVVGNRMQDSHGNVVTPYGVSVVGGPQSENWGGTEGAAVAQIRAAHRYWHANAIRIQIGEQLPFQALTPGRGYNVQFVESLDRLVCLALSQGDIPVINDTTLFTGGAPGPTQGTIRFWRFIAQRYGNTFPVIFDLFNEPQLNRDSIAQRRIKPRTAWHIWRFGGHYRGVEYVGMQKLVDAIRNQGARNVIWVEEPYSWEADRARFDLLPKYRLRATDIVYAFHKPNMDPSSRSFRDVRAVARLGLPLINSEWGQFAATDRPWMCQPDSYRTAPRYLEQMRALGIGVLTWSLQPGALVKGVAGRDTVHDGGDLRFTIHPQALAAPSVMKSSYGCTNPARGQGAGRLVMNYFARYGAPPPATVFPKLG